MGLWLRSLLKEISVTNNSLLESNIGSFRFMQDFKRLHPLPPEKQCLISKVSTKLCVAVSFTPVDPKFLVQQRFSLTLQPQRPAPAKVNETLAQYRHHNALVIVLLVRKIPKMKFILSCASSRQDVRRLRKYFRLEVQLAY